MSRSLRSFWPIGRIMDLISCPRPPPKGPVDMDGPIAKYVKDTIAQDMVVIFSKTYCPYCKLAKEVFDGIKKTYTCVELDNRNDGDSIQNILGVITGARTVPRVFVNGVCVGGGSDVKELHEKGELQKLLAAK